MLRACRGHHLLSFLLFNCFIINTRAILITSLIIPPPSFTTASNATVTWVHGAQDPSVIDIQLLHKSGVIDVLATNVNVSQNYYIAESPFTTLKVNGWGQIQLIKQDDRSILARTTRLRVQAGNVIVPYSQDLPVITQSNPTPSSTVAAPSATSAPSASSNSSISNDGADAATGEAGASSTSSSVSASTTFSLGPSPLHTATPTALPSPSSNTSSSLSTPTRAGIGIGVAASVSLIGLTALFLLKRYRRQKHEFRTKKSVKDSSTDDSKESGYLKAELEGTGASGPKGKEVAQVQQQHPTPVATTATTRTLTPPVASGSLPTVEEEEYSPRSIPNADTARRPRRGETFDTSVSGLSSSSNNGVEPAARQQTFDTVSTTMDPGPQQQMRGGSLASQRSWGTASNSGASTNEGPVELDAGTVDLEAQGINEALPAAMRTMGRFSFNRGDSARRGVEDDGREWGYGWGAGSNWI